jgi:hypothetical protein
VTGVGTWAGNLTSNRCAIGSTGVGSYWLGQAACAALFNRELTPDEMALLDGGY